MDLCVNSLSHIIRGNTGADILIRIDENVPKANTLKKITISHMQRMIELYDYWKIITAYLSDDTNDNLLKGCDDKIRNVILEYCKLNAFGLNIDCTEGFVRGGFR